jgi:hypothetical protein
MACELTTGFNVDCKSTIGGIKKIWVQQSSDFISGVTTDGTTGEIDALPEATIYPYEVAKGTTSAFVESITTDNGNLFYTQTVTLVLQGLTAAKRKQLHLLAQNRGLVVFIQDNNNSIWMVGRTRGAEVTAREAATGAALADLNGYTVTFVAEEPSPAERLENYTTSPFDNFADITIGTAV